MYKYIFQKSKIVIINLIKTYRLFLPNITLKNTRITYPHVLVNMFFIIRQKTGCYIRKNISKILNF